MKKNTIRKISVNTCIWSAAWSTAKVILGTNTNLAPTVIKKFDDKGDVEMVTNPQKLASMFNHFF